MICLLVCPALPRPGLHFRFEKVHHRPVWATRPYTTARPTTSDTSDLDSDAEGANPTSAGVATASKSHPALLADLLRRDAGLVARVAPGSARRTRLPEGELAIERLRDANVAQGKGADVSGCVEDRRHGPAYECPHDLDPFGLASQRKCSIQGMPALLNMILCDPYIFARHAH